MAAARSGDQQAFGRLIEARWKRLVRLARSIAGDVDAEDVAQEASVACWRKLSQLGDPARFDSWLMRSVFRRAVRRARWQRVRAALMRTSGSELRTSNDAPNPASDVFVWQVLSRLAPRQRAVVHLTVIEGMTDSEIAQALGIRAGSVRAHRRRARETIELLVRSPMSDVRSQTSDAAERQRRNRETGDERAGELRRSVPHVGRAAAGNKCD